MKLRVETVGPGSGPVGRWRISPSPPAGPKGIYYLAELGVPTALLISNRWR